MPTRMLTFLPPGDHLVISENLHRYLTEYCASNHFRPAFRRRSHLFVPLNKTKYLDKVDRGEIAADGFIWDLEDSIPADQKETARANIPHIPEKSGTVEYNVRINAGDADALALDIPAIGCFPFDSVTLPKGESPAAIAHLIRDIGAEKAYIVTIETLKGLCAVEEIASVLRSGKDALGFGVGDMSTDLNLERLPTTSNPFFQQMLGTIALAGKKYKLDLFDSVSAKFNDLETTRHEAELSCHCFGFTGKKLINPKQVEVINTVFSPSRRGIEDDIATLECFLSPSESNAHVVVGEYKGVPAYKAADQKIKKYLTQVATYQATKTA